MQLDVNAVLDELVQINTALNLDLAMARAALKQQDEEHTAELAKVREEGEAKFNNAAQQVYEQGVEHGIEQSASKVHAHVNGEG